MRSLDELGRLLLEIDGRGYKAYKEIAGRYQGPGFVLSIDHVQGDPFAEPSRVRLLVEPSFGAYPEWTLSSEARRVATADFINRRLHNELGHRNDRQGSGKSGLLEVLRPGQQILRRTSLLLNSEGEVEARIRVGLPARGRTVLGRVANRLLLEQLVSVLHRGLLFESHDSDALLKHIECYEDSLALRSRLQENGLVAFVPNGASLPRRSGVDDRPAAQSGVVLFKAPVEREITLDTPHRGPVNGMGVPAGITLIVGGGYHGKSTLLRAIELGVYDHIPGDGREGVVALDSAVKIRAEDGRAVSGVDISNFIDGLPGGNNTRHFHSENASGSTSQAASITEALEVGCRCLLLDEDTCATNFMIRDARMQRLVACEHEPITPFIDRASFLSDELGVSAVIVVGGAGDYFDVADCVIGMQEYRPRDLSAEAKEISAALPSVRSAVSRSWNPIATRRLKPASLGSRNDRRDGKVSVRDLDKMQFGEEHLELGAVEQLVEVGQLRGIAAALLWGRDDFERPPESMAEFFDAIISRVQSQGLSSVLKRPSGDCAEFRVAELASVLARIRSLKTESVNLN